MLKIKSIYEKAASAEEAFVYMEKAEELGAWIGAQGKWLVYGGSNLGLMEATARAVKAHGGQVMGVVPTLLEERGRVSTLLDVIFPTVNLSDRKDLMLAQCDVAVALPGGVGTLDEVFTMAASATIGYHHKPVILLNAGGFWDTLIALLDDLQLKGVVRGQWRDIIKEAAGVDDAIRLLQDI